MKAFKKPNRFIFNLLQLVLNFFIDFQRQKCSKFSLFSPNIIFLNDFCDFQLKVSKIQKSQILSFLPFQEAPLAALFRKFSSFGEKENLFPRSKFNNFLKNLNSLLLVQNLRFPKIRYFLIKSKKESWAIF